MLHAVIPERKGVEIEEEIFVDIANGLIIFVVYFR